MTFGECQITARDVALINEIYYYCLSLAREHAGHKFFDALDQSKLRAEVKLFLKGFYYRISGQPEKAIGCLNEALSIRPNMAKARRELANALIAVEDYDSAEKLCIENYRDDNKNPYYIHPYFNTMIHKYIGMRKDYNLGITDIKELNRLKETMKSLIDAISENRSEKAGQMCICMKAEYAAFVNDDALGAFRIISNGVTRIGGSSVFVYLTQFDIAYYIKNTIEMEKALDNINAIVSNQSYFNNALMIRKIRYTSLKGEKDKANSMIRHLKDMPKRFIEKLKNEIEFNCD